MSRVQANTKVEIEYTEGKTIQVVTLTGGRMQKVLALQRHNIEQFSGGSEGVIPDLQAIPQSLALCLDDEKRANELWENELTVDDAAEIVAGTIRASQASEDDRKKSD